MEAKEQGRVTLSASPYDVSGSRLLIHLAEREGEYKRERSRSKEKLHINGHRVAVVWRADSFDRLIERPTDPERNQVLILVFYLGRFRWRPHRTEANFLRQSDLMNDNK